MGPNTNVLLEELAKSLSTISVSGPLGPVNMPNVEELLETMHMAFDDLVFRDQVIVIEFYRQNNEQWARQKVEGANDRLYVLRDNGRWAFGDPKKTSFVGPGSRIEKELETQFAAHLGKLVVT